jgi:ribosomal protein L37AE/L43A
MGYNATYGTQNYDSMSEFEVQTKKNPECESFLCQDELGNIHVKAKYRICDLCGANIGGDVGFIHGSYMYCEKCEKIHRKNEQYLKDKQRINNKINKIKKGKTK